MDSDQGYKMWLPTFTGKRVDVWNPDPDTIYLMDIAHHLSQENRYNGATIRPYSVAEHSVRLSWVVPPCVARLAILHDAAEAYWKDMPRPVKNSPKMKAYRDGIASMEKLIFDRFGVTEELKLKEAEILWKIDEAMPIAEVMHSGLYRHSESIAPMNGEGEGGEEIAEKIFTHVNKINPTWGWLPALAKSMFLNRAIELGIIDKSISGITYARWESICRQCGRLVVGTGTSGKCINPNCGKTYSIEGTI